MFIVSAGDWRVATVDVERRMDGRGKGQYVGGTQSKMEVFLAAK